MADEPTPINGADVALEGEALDAYIGELNAKALSAAIDSLRERVDKAEAAAQAAGFTAASAMRLIQKQSQFIGQLTQEVRGSGSTTKEG